MNTIDIQEENQETEIDLVALFMKIKSLWYVAIIGMLIGAIVTVAYAAFLSTPLYSSSSLVYLRGSSSTISLQDLQVGSELTSDYEVIFKSRPNMEKIIDDLDLDMSTSTLSSMITITNMTDNRFLQVTVTSEDPELSKNIANEVVECGMDNIREIDSQEPYLVEDAIANNQKIGSSTLKKGIIGALAGLIVALGIIFIHFILSDRMTSIEDVERTLELPVLAVVIEDKSLNYKKRRLRKK